MIPRNSLWNTPVHPVRRSSSCPNFGRIKNNDAPLVTLLLNNNPVNLPAGLALEVAHAGDELRLNPNSARTLKKELILDETILLGLINETKLGTQVKSRSVFFHAYDSGNSIESAFVENKFLSKNEQAWVKKTITEYKQSVREAVAGNNSSPTLLMPIPVAKPDCVARCCSIM